MLLRKTRLVALLVLLVLMVQCLASCTVEFSGSTTSTSSSTSSSSSSSSIEEPPSGPRDPYGNLSQTMYNIGDKTLVYNYTAEDEAAIRANIAEANEMLANGEDVDAFISLYETLDAQFSTLTSHYQMAYLENRILPTSQEANDNFLYISDLRTEMIKELMVMYRTIYDSSFRDVFYEGWTEEEIQSVLDEADLYTDEFVALQAQANELQVAYAKLDPSTESGRLAIAKLYIDFAKVKNEIAVLLGYENYMEYAYASVYSRDYSYEQASEMAALLKEHVLPHAGMMYSTFQANQKALQNSSSPLDYGTFLNLASTWRFFDRKAKPIVESFVEELGGNAKELYDDMWENGNYFIISASTADAGAFTWYLYEQEKPIMYFGPGYQDIFTFTHEFGHYMAQINSPEGGNNYDIAEIQSQGAEMLLLSYLKDKYKPEIVNLLVQYNMVNNLFILGSAMAVNEFETYVYTHLDTINAAQLAAKYEEILVDLVGKSNVDSGLFNKDYWSYVVVDNPGYYVSYAMSAIPALEIFATAQNDWDAALAQYNAMAYAQTPNFCEELEKAGIYSPFDPRAHELIAQMMASYINGPIEK